MRRRRPSSARCATWSGENWETRPAPSPPSGSTCLGTSSRGLCRAAPPWTWTGPAGRPGRVAATVFVSCGELYIGRRPPWPGPPPSPSSHTSTRKTRGCRLCPAAERPGQPRSCSGAPLPRGRRPLWDAGPRGHPRLGPALAEGHLIEPSTPRLPPTLGRGHWQLDLTQGAPLLTPPLRPEHQLTEHCVPSRGQGSLVHVAGWRPRGPFLWHHPPPPATAPCPAPCCKLLLGFRVLAPSPKHTHSLQSPPTLGQVVP